MEALLAVWSAELVWEHGKRQEKDVQELFRRLEGWGAQQLPVLQQKFLQQTVISMAV